MGVTRRTATVCALVLLAGCQLLGGGRDADPPASGGTSEITVTTLDPRMAAAVDPGEEEPEAATRPEASAPAVDLPDAGPTPTGEEDDLAPPSPVVAEKPPLQIACEKRGGRWATAGATGSKACVTPTRDGGKQCTRETDCDGLCLARSGSCAPVKPMFGCAEILQADGRRVTLCID